MSFLAKVLYHGFKLTGIKKMNKINEKRDFFIPEDHKIQYERHDVLDKYSCLAIKQNKTPSSKAILFFFGEE